MSSVFHKGLSYNGLHRHLMQGIKSGYEITLTTVLSTWVSFLKTSVPHSHCRSSQKTVPADIWLHWYVPIRSTTVLDVHFLVEVQPPLMPSMPWLIWLWASGRNLGGNKLVTTWTIYGAKPHNSLFAGVLIEPVED